MNKHTASVVQGNFRKMYQAKQYSVNGTVYINSYGDLIENKVLWSGELDSPVLEKDNEFFIASTKDVVKIEKVIRSSDNSYIYFTQDKYIEDELSEESKAKAEEEKVKIEEKNESLNLNKNEYLQDSLETVVKNINKMEDAVELMNTTIKAAKKVINAYDSEELDSLLNKLSGKE